MTALGTIRSWFTEERAASTDYTSQVLAASLAAASGYAGIRGSACYGSALNLISASASVSELSGAHAAALRPHLGAIARGLTDRGESTFSIEVSSTGELMLIPVKIADVIGTASPETWVYSVTRSGPSENTAIALPSASILAFKINASASRAWRGIGSLQAASGGTADLLAELEKQMTVESRMPPSRLISAGVSKEQRTGVQESVSKGGIVVISGGRSGGRDPAGALSSGVIKGEITAAGVTLHEQLSSLVSSVLGVPPDLIVAGSEAGSRESFRRFAATTISALVESIKLEWSLKIGELDISMDRLRAGDIAARARAVGSRANAFKNLVGAGLDIERALQISGLDD